MGSEDAKNQKTKKATATHREEEEFGMKQRAGSMEKIEHFSEHKSK